MKSSNIIEEIFIVFSIKAKTLDKKDIYKLIGITKSKNL